MRNSLSSLLASLTLLLAMLLTGAAIAAEGSQSNETLSGWTTDSPRDETRPTFERLPSGGRDGGPALAIAAADRPGISGAWVREYPVEGTVHYRITAHRKSDGISSPNRSCVVRIDWRDAEGQRVESDRGFVEGYLSGWNDVVPPEYPPDRETDGQGWTRMSDDYPAPAGAVVARVELHLRWAPGGSVRYSDISFEAVDPPAARPARLAALHVRPPGPTPADNAAAMVPLIRRAARDGAELIVLPETINVYATGKKAAEVAESIPGPTTDTLAEVAKAEDCYVVVGLFEREGPVVYNSAILIGPSGTVEGRYRKVCLPRSEIEQGVTPGDEYPVFDTRFGRLGMMVCYDGFFPEVARELAANGAEVIAWPVWGCNPLLAQARAVENHVYLVSSTYEPPEKNWMLSAVYDHSGQTLARGETWGTVVAADVDLQQRTHWRSLGDFRAEWPRHRPADQ